MKPRSAMRVAALVRAGQWRVAVYTMLCAAILMSIIGVYALRIYERHAMDLVARSLAFAAEPAVRFNDKLAMREMVDSLVGPARIAEIHIADRQGREWFQYTRPSTGWVDDVGRQVESWLVEPPAGAVIGDSHAPIGRITLRSDGQTLIRYMSGTLLAVLLCAGVAALLVRRFSRQVATSLALPIDSLATLTRHIRESRSFDRRAKGSTVLEIDALAEDFNALLDELQRQRAMLKVQNADLRRANESFKNLSRHDPLTKLPNRAYLGERLDEVIERCRVQQTQAGLVFIDTDRFKEINDRFGHAGGDALLVELSRRLRASIRESDFVARLGGDEFVIVISPLGDPGEIAHLTARIRSALDRPVDMPEGLQHTVSVTMGVSIFPDHANSVAALIEAADEAMYRAKAAGRGSVVVYEPYQDTIDQAAPMAPDGETR